MLFFELIEKGRLTSPTADATRLMLPPRTSPTANTLGVLDERTDAEPARGKTRLRSVLLNFLIPLHVMAEVGGLSVSIREAAISADAADETHSAWTLKLVGTSGMTCTLTWRTLRKWDGAHVVYEHHYDHKQVGGPLTSDDLGFDTAVVDGGLRLPS